LTCKSDYNNKPCRWTSSCIEKICENAPTTIKSYDECYKFLPTCTLANSGFGCMQLPLRCLSIEKKDGCRLRTSIKLNSTAECEWYNGKCVDKTCETAPFSITSNS
jgi:Notch-like protein